MCDRRRLLLKLVVLEKCEELKKRISANEYDKLNPGDMTDIFWAMDVEGFAKELVRLALKSSDGDFDRARGLVLKLLSEITFIGRLFRSIFISLSLS